MGDKGEGEVKHLKKWVTSFMEGPYSQYMRNGVLKIANSSNVKIWMDILEMIWSSLSTFQSPTTFHDISSSFIEMNLISMTNDFCTTLTSVKIFF